MLELGQIIALLVARIWNIFFEIFSKFCLGRKKYMWVTCEQHYSVSIGESCRVRGRNLPTIWRYFWFKLQKWVKVLMKGKWKLAEILKCKKNQGSNNKILIINDSGPRSDQDAFRYTWHTHNIGKCIMNVGNYFSMIGNIHKWFFSIHERFFYINNSFSSIRNIYSIFIIQGIHEYWKMNYENLKMIYDYWKRFTDIEKWTKNIEISFIILENNHGFPKFLNIFSKFIIILQYWKLIMNIEKWIMNIGKRILNIAIFFIMKTHIKCQPGNSVICVFISFNLKRNHLIKKILNGLLNRL